MTCQGQRNIDITQSHTISHNLQFHPDEMDENIFFFPLHHHLVRCVSLFVSLRIIELLVLSHHGYDA